MLLRPTATCVLSLNSLRPLFEAGPGVLRYYQLRSGERLQTERRLSTSHRTTIATNVHAAGDRAPVFHNSFIRASEPIIKVAVSPSSIGDHLARGSEV
jgi:hypothetical protein